MPPLFRKSKNQKHLPAIPFDKCAAKTTADGKPGTCVVDHCINVGRVAEALIALQPERVKRLFPPKPGLSVSVHDVGKVSPGYENKYFRDTVVREYAPELCSQLSFSTHHAAISAAAIDRLLGSSVSHSPVALAAAAHHGKKDKSYPPDTAETLGGPAWSEERQKLIERLSTVFGGTLQDAAHADPWLLAGLTCVSDWIGSDEMFFPADRPPVEQDDAMLTARRAVAECGFVPAMTQKGLSFEDVFGFAAHPPQRQFIDRVTQPGLYVLEAPMGIGKTEAALYAAYKLMEAGCHQGLYFALPTRLTSDRIHARVSRFLARISEAQLAPKLAHGMAWLYECRWRPAADDDDDAISKRSVHAWFNPSKRALLYPYAVGTIDQALLGVLNVKHNFVRLFGLAGKVVILDEVHSYDIYTGTLLDELAERLLRIGCTVIVLSATLTGQRRTRLAPALGTLAGTDAYPLITGCPENGRVFAAELAAPAPKKVHVRTEAWDNLAVATEAVSAARRGECVVCIANTVAKAQVWYRAVKTVMPENAFPVGILHARFPMFRREQIEDEWMARLGKEEGNRPEGCVLIATQIVEQSVDIDADRMITELAPSDMLLQRMGRLWRHPRDNRPCPAPGLIIISQDLSSCASAEQTLEALGKENACVYAPYVLMRTFEVWKTHSGITLPHDIRTLIEDTYVEREEASDTAMGAFKIRLSERCERLRKLACSAKDSNQGFPSGEDDERAATRYSDLPTQSVLLLAAPPDELARGRARVRLTDGGDWLLDAYRPDFEATRRLHANTVSVAAYLLSEPSHTRNDVAWLNRHFYDKPVVLVCDGRGVLCDLNGAATVLRYSPEYGVWRGDKTQEIASEPSDAYSEDIVFDNLKRDW